jgi:hypothetical protein
MTAAPTPRDGERDLAEKIGRACMTISEPEHGKVTATFHTAEAETLIAAHIAQRVAEAVGPLEADNRALREDVQMALKCFSLMPEATPHDTKYGIWKMWTDGCNHLKRALAPKEGK